MSLTPADVIVGDILRITQDWRVTAKTGDNDSNYTFTFETMTDPSADVGPFDLAQLGQAEAIEFLDRPWAEGQSVLWLGNPYTIFGLHGDYAWINNGTSDGVVALVDLVRV